MACPGLYDRLFVAADALPNRAPCTRLQHALPGIDAGLQHDVGGEEDEQATRYDPGEVGDGDAEVILVCLVVTICVAAVQRRSLRAHPHNTHPHLQRVFADKSRYDLA